MEIVFIKGSAETAPRCIASAGAIPAWSGKARSELTRGDLDEMLAFCVLEGKRLGYEDYRLGRHVRVNPFDRRFLHGMPNLYFKSYYEKGWQDAKDAHAESASQLPLLAVA